MAIVYGYFSDEELARQAARRCEEMGVTSAVLTSMDAPIGHVEEGTVSHSLRRREYFVVRSGLIGAAVLGILGFIAWFIMPGTHDKLNLAGPLISAMYGAAIGVGLGMWIGPRRHMEDAMLPSDVVMHPASERVVVINTSDSLSTFDAEELLEREGAIEVIHRAA
jgi:hypothetical protein